MRAAGRFEPADSVDVGPLVTRRTARDVARITHQRFLRRVGPDRDPERIRVEVVQQSVAFCIADQPLPRETAVGVIAEALRARRRTAADSDALLLSQ